MREEVARENGEYVIQILLPAIETDIKTSLLLDYQPFRRGKLIENLPISNLPINF
jgi:hypothetical protein